MHIFPITVKPVEPTGTFNGLLNAIALGDVRGEFEGSMSFMEAEAFANPDLAHRGALNPQYNEVARLTQLDPTSELAMSLELAHLRSPRGNVGYTHEFRFMEYSAAIAAQFASWFREFQTAYELARKAEASLAGGDYTLLDMELDLRYGEGHVAGFYAMVGDFSSGLLSYPASEPLSVESVYAKVRTALEDYLDILDNEGYASAEGYVNSKYGIGSIPQTGIGVAFMSSNTVDRIYRAPWARILTVPRARELLKEQFLDRVESAVVAAASSSEVNVPQALSISIAEGDDVFDLGTSWFAWSMGVFGTGIDIGEKGAAFFGSQSGRESYWNYLTTVIDSRPRLSNSLYNQKGSWMDQFYTKGDLVQSILDRQVDAYGGGGLAVGLGPLRAIDGATDDAAYSQVYDYDTSVMSSTSPRIKTEGRYNWIAGCEFVTNPVTLTNDISVAPVALADSSEISTAAHAGAGSDYLPNGVLYIGVPGEASAVNWIHILRSLKLQMPTQGIQLLEKTGRAKRSLPSGAPTVASSDSLIAEVIANGQRDGFINSPMLAFNITRMSRVEQEGPVFAGSGDGHVSTFGMSQLNGWDRLDTGEGKYVVTPKGAQIDLTGAISSRFTGEYDAGRFSVWQPELFTESIALGGGTVEARVCENLLSYPMAFRSADRSFHPRYQSSSTVANMAAILAGTGVDPTTIAGVTEGDIGLGLAAFFDISLAQAAGFNTGYEWNYAMESLHPTRGFLRGLASASFSGRSLNGALANDYVAWPREISPRTNLGSQHEDTIGNLDFYDDVNKHPVPPVMKALQVGDSVGYHTNGVNIFDWDDVSDQAWYYDGIMSDVDCQNWYWDPTRTNFVGKTWHRWAGHSMTGALPHPYVTKPIAAFSSAMRLADVNKLGPMNVRSTSQYVAAEMGKNDVTDMEDRGLPSHFSEIVFHDYTDNESPLSSALAEGLMEVLPAGALPVGMAACNPALVGDRLAGLLTAEVRTGEVNVDGMSMDLALADIRDDLNSDLTALPFIDMIHPITNGCMRKPMFRSVGTTLQNAWKATGLSAPERMLTEAQVLMPNSVGTNGMGIAGGTDERDVSVLPKYQGEILIPFGCAGQGATTVIEGTGILFSDDLLSETITDAWGWYKSQFKANSSYLSNMYPNTWPVVGLNGRIDRVEIPHLGQNHVEDTLLAPNANGFRPVDLFGIAPNSRVSELGADNDWFRKGPTLSSRHARLRRRVLASPWQRGVGQSGVFNLKYDSSQILPIFNSAVKRYVSDGKRFQKGLENSMFLEIHLAN